MTQAGVLAAAKALETVEFGGLAPAEKYTGTPNEQLQRVTVINRPSLEDAAAGGTGVTTAAALLLFRDAGAELVLLEVGLGGRLDSTNVVTPAVTCVTTIELEHTDKLGDTISLIAAEKAGIIKRDVPCLVGRLVPDADAVIRARAAELDAPLIALGKDFEPIAGSQLFVHSIVVRV